MSRLDWTNAAVDHSRVADPVPGNVVSRGVQFAVYRRIAWAALSKGYDLRHPRASYFAWNLPPQNDAPKKHKPAAGLDVLEKEDVEGGEGDGWTPFDVGDKELVPVVNRWIYAFETGHGPKGKIGLLVREYHADDKGKLTFVEGAKRRGVDATDEGEPIGQSIPDVGLPHARQTEHCHYVFVATRGRLCWDAIADLQKDLSGSPGSWGMPSIYKPVNLGDSLPVGADGTTYVPVIDPLTLGESLGRSYRRALNWAINLTVPHDENPKLKEAKVTALKYQLGTMIRDSLLHEGKDPLGIKPELVNEGELMLHFLAKHEGSLSDAQKQTVIQIAALVVFLESDIWSQAKRWYLGTKDTGPTTAAAQSIGHYFLASREYCHRRFRETEIGCRHLDEVMDAPDGPLAWLFEPPKEQSHARETYEQWHQIVRKTLTTAVLGIAEFGPMLAASRKVADANEMIRHTLWRIFPLTKPRVLKTAKTRNLLAHLLKHQPEWQRVMVHSQSVLHEVEHWIDKDGKTHWPHGSKFAKPAEILSMVLAGVELINLADKFQLAMRELSRQEGGRQKSTLTVVMEMTVASLDVLVAAEEPIREYGLYMAEGGSAETVIEKLLSPAAFKILGGVSSALEGITALVEAHEAAERGERGVSVGYHIVSNGAFLASLGSFMAFFIADPIAFPLLSAASLGLIAVGVAAVAIGYMVVACLTTTAWQSFAGHCVFGRDKSDGKTSWSGSEFHEWKQDPEGLALQIRALTAMLCGFSMRGEGSKGANSVRISFGSLPPNAKLQIQFELALDDGTTSRPGYLIDLEESGGLIHNWGGPPACRQLEPSFEKGRLRTLIVAPLWPEGHWAVRSECWAVIQYAPQAANGEEGVATGTIPVHGNFNYKIVEPGALGIAHMNVLESIDATAKVSR